MDRVAVIADSSSCIHPHIVSQYDIYILPLLLIFEDRSYRDGIDIIPQEFYELLKSTKKLPTSSSPSPGEYLEAFRELSKRTNSILCITLPTNIGMAFDSAMEAKEMAKEEIPQVSINVLPSRGPALTQGFIAQSAAQAAALGKDLTQVTQVAQDMIKQVNAIAMLDTLYYLAKGGRIPKAAAWAGSLLNIKPILDVTEDVHMIERRRTKKRALQRMLDIMRQRTQGKPVHVNLMQANVPEEAERFKANILSQFNCPELYVTDFTPVMGVHTGPGTLAISFYADASAQQ